MAPKNKKRHLRRIRTYRVVFAAIFVCIMSGFGVYQYVNANASQVAYGRPIDPNIGIRTRVEEFFIENDAQEMISIIQCESQFRHYNTEGSLLQNRAGSSAVGVAQILSSTHPDPKVLKQYNTRYNTNLTINDFDIATLEGNLGYALVLYKVRGTRDWECSKRFRFNS